MLPTAERRAGTAWLLTGSVAVMLTGVTLAAKALPVSEFPQGMTRQIAPTFGLAVGFILVIGAARPAPMVLVAAVAGVLFLTWLWLFILSLALGGVASVADESGLGNG